MNNIIDKAYKFAEKKHDATGKLYGGKAFIVHPIEVAHIIKYLLIDPGENLIAAGYLHDTLEDTDTTYEELVKEFNEDIAGLVREVTKDENNDFPNLSTYRGLILKAADNLANVSNIENMTDKEKQKKLFKKYSSMYIYAGSNLKLHE